jgi:predicted nucleic acid-binding protein
MADNRWLLDTNILLRMVQSDSPSQPTILSCLDFLWQRGAELHYTSQNLAEFWNVCTRPIDRNGFSYSIEQTERFATQIEARLAFADDSEATHREWRKLVLAQRVSGVPVHDARLVAAMHIHGIPNLLTLNVADFRRYSTILAAAPNEVLTRRS